MDERHEVDVLAGAVHGALAAGHALGAVYNIRRKNTFQAFVHIGALVFDLFCTYDHIKDARKPK